MTAEGLQILTPLLSRLRNLEALDVSSNATPYNVSDDACANLRDIFTHLTHLKRLDMSNNRTTHKLGRILGALPAGLEYLRLSGCGVNASDLSYLRRSHHGVTLRELDLSDNSVTHERMLPLTELLTVLSPHLSVLEMEGCNLEAIDLCTFLDCVAKLQQLEYINLARNDSLNGSMIDSCVRMLASMPTVKAFKVSLPDWLTLDEMSDEDLVPNIMAFKHRLVELVSYECSQQNRSAFDIAFDL